MKHDTPGTLHLATIEAIKYRPSFITYKHIEEGTQVPQKWILDFVAGRVKGPNVNRVQAVYEFLTDRRLLNR